MKKILAIALLSTGISIAITNSPAYAGCVSQEQYNRAQEEVRNRNSNSKTTGRTYEYTGERACIPHVDYDPSGKNPSPSNSPNSSSSSSDDGYIFKVLNPGVTFSSTNGVSKYGLQIIVGADNIHGRTSFNFGEGYNTDFAFTYNLSKDKPFFNPFIGAGIVFKSIQNANSSDGISIYGYGMGGVDLNLNDSINVTGAVKLPMSSNYDTEFQATMNFH
jgi:hypothetical protein